MPDMNQDQANMADNTQNEGNGKNQAADLAAAAADQLAVETELQQLRDEIDQVKDHALRSQAELENYRKRVQREMNDERKYANMKMLRDLLPVLDNIQRAIEAAEKASDAGSLLQGVKMVGKQLESVLEQNHCQRIEALHQEFDPSFHEAILQQPSKDFPPNTVLMVVTPGYRLHDRVVRAAQVIVSTTAPADENTDGQKT